MGLGLSVGSLYTIHVISHEGDASTVTTGTISFPALTSNTGTQVLGSGQISVSCSPNPAVIGTEVTCSASIPVSVSAGAKMISWASDISGSFTSATCNAASGSCAVGFTPLSAGTANVSASFFVGGQQDSGEYAVIVDRASTLTLITCAPLVTIGSSSQCTATVVGYGTPTGNVSFSASGSGTFAQSDCILNGGTCSVSYTPSGVSVTSQSIIATYEGDSANSGSVSSAYPLTVGTHATSSSVVCTPDSITIGSSTSCAVSVSGLNPSGSVDLTSSDSNATFTPSAQCTLQSGSCSVIAYTPSKAGSTRILASYLGDSDNAPSSSATILSVNVETSSATVSCSPSPIAIGSKSNCTASVTGYNPTGLVSWIAPSGSFSGNDTCHLSFGSCSISYTALSSTSPVTIQGSYAGDSDNSPSLGSFQLALTSAQSSATVVCTPNPDTIGSSSSCSATVTGYGVPSGTISFSSTDTGAAFVPTACTLVASGPSSSSCSSAYSPSTAGSASITAKYSGDSNNSASNSSPFGISISKASPAVSVSCSAVNVGGNSLCTGSVTGGFNPSGTLSFSSSDSGSTFTSSECTIASGSCSVTYTPSAAGSATIQAVYSGDPNNNANSNGVNLNVGMASSVVTVVCIPQSISSNSSTSCTVTVSGYGTPSGTVNWQTSGNGTFSSSPASCVLSSGQCSLSYTATNDVPSAVVMITATYLGDSNNSGNLGTYNVDIS